jgi:hypothetical protein
MAESRGRKSKKGRWQLILGVKETVFTLVGIIGLVMMSFAVGTLAGRGDIYRVLYNWGFLGPEAAKALQPWNPPQAAVPTLPPVSPPAAQPPGSTLTTAAPINPAAPTPHQGSIAGPVSATPAAPPAAKKSKPSANQASPHKTKEEELRRMREEVAKKLKFQNSLDIATPRPAKTRDSKVKIAEKPSSTTMVRVAKYRDKKAAKARVAELQKQGDAVTLKEGKDEKGPYFLVYRQKSADAPKRPSVAQNKTKRAGTKLKTKGE